MAGECVKPLRFGGVSYHSRTYSLLTNLAVRIPTVEAESDRTLPFLSCAWLGVGGCPSAQVGTYHGASENDFLASGKEMSEEKLLFSLLNFFKN